MHANSQLQTGSVGVRLASACTACVLLKAAHLCGRRGDGHVTRGNRDVHALVQLGVEVLGLLPLVARFLSGAPAGVKRSTLNKLVLKVLNVAPRNRILFACLPLSQQRTKATVG